MGEEQASSAPEVGDNDSRQDEAAKVGEEAIIQAMGDIPPPTREGYKDDPLSRSTKKNYRLAREEAYAVDPTQNERAKLKQSSLPEAARTELSAEWKEKGKELAEQARAEYLAEAAQRKTEAIAEEKAFQEANDCLVGRLTHGLSPEMQEHEVPTLLVSAKINKKTGMYTVRLDGGKTVSLNGESFNRLRQSAYEYMGFTGPPDPRELNWQGTAILDRNARRAVTLLSDERSGFFRSKQHPNAGLAEALDVLLVAGAKDEEDTVKYIEETNIIITNGRMWQQHYEDAFSTDLAWDLRKGTRKSRFWDGDGELADAA